MEAVAVANTFVNSRMNAGNHSLICKDIKLYRSDHAISANAKKVKYKINCSWIAFPHKYFFSLINVYFQ